MIGLSSSLVKGGMTGRTYVKDGLKLYMPYRGSDASEVKFVGTGSTSFDGTNDYIDCGNDSTLQITGKTITVSAWINISTFGDYDIIASNASGGNWINGWTLWGATTAMKFSINHYGTNAALTGDVTSDVVGKWAHVAGVYDGNLASANIKIYFNGVLGATTDNYTTDIGNSTNTLIGKADDTTSEPVKTSKSANYSTI